jgi:hypothetical protein
VGTKEEQDNLRNMSAFSDCTPEQRASVVPYSLAPLTAEFLHDQNESAIISSGIVSYESQLLNKYSFLHNYDASKVER